MRGRKPKRIGSSRPTTPAGNGRLGYMVCGMSYRASPVEVREKVAIPAKLISEAHHYLMAQPGVKECMILSTCNRMELYLSAKRGLDGHKLLVAFIRELRKFDLTPFIGQIYVFRGLDAIAHSFRVASSLDSLVLGEPQILGQTKAAFRAAETNGCVERHLHRWIPRAFAAAKQIRHETGISRSPVSVSSAAIQLAKGICGDLSGKSVVLLGAGKMGELSAQHLKESGASSIVVINRTLTRAAALADRFSGSAVAFKWRIKHIADADVVICSTEAPAFLLTARDVERALARRPHRPLLLLDISVPRNVDPKAAEIEGVHLFNIDDLENVVKANRKRRQAGLERAEAEMRNSLDRFQQEEKNFKAAPAIAAIRNQVRSVCQTELKRFEQKVRGLNEDERDELKMMLHRIAQKILHPAIMELKAIHPHKRKTSKQALIEQLFGTGPNEE